MKYRPATVGRVLGWLFVLAMAAFVVHTLGVDALLQPWRQLSLAQAVLAVVLIVFTYVLRSLRQSAYFPDAMRGRFWLSTRLMVWHNFYNNFLPMRSGELAFPLLAQRYFGIGLAHAAGALLWFRLLDLWAIALMGLAAAALHDARWLVVAGGLLPVPWLAVTLARPTQAWLDAHPRPLLAKAGRVLAALPSSPAALWSSCGWTLVNWAVKLMVFAWLLKAFVPLGWTAAIVGAIGGDLTSVLPVHSPAGLGSYEAGVVAALLPFGVAAASAVPAALSLHLMILASTVLGALLLSVVPAPAPLQEEN